MKIYLAATYSRHPEMREVRSTLESLGHIVTGRWINGNHEVTNKSYDRQGEIFAIEDYEDLVASELVISFTEEPRSTSGRGRGGRHVEFGIALALNKSLVVIGHRENVFHYLPQVQFFPSFELYVTQLVMES